MTCKLTPSPCFRTNNQEEPRTKLKKRENGSTEQNERDVESPIKCYEAGQILKETRLKMREIDRRNLDSKAKRSSIHYSIEKNTLNLLDNANGHDDDSSTKLSKDENLPQDDVTKQNIKSEIVKQGVRKKLPPISRHAHSFNEFDHKRLSRQTSEQYWSAISIFLN